MNESASLGETIRDRRLALGYSLGQLATKVNKTASSIRAWERGDARPTDGECEELAAALDLDASHLASLKTDLVWKSEEVEEVEVDDPWPHGVDPAATTPAPSGDAATDGSAGAEDGVDAESDEAGGDQPVTEDSLRTADNSDSEHAASDTDDGGELAEGAAADRAPTDNDMAPPDPTLDPELAGFFEAETEAVPVVPGSSVAVAQPQADPVLVYTPEKPVAARSDNPVVAAWDDLRDLYYRIFDPRRRWIYRIRFVLILIAFLIMLRILAWAAGNLFEAIGEVLDSISFSPADTPDVEN